ncbi:MAG: TIGR01777 family oxidoreductase [Bdellovibrionales bacterium]|nr:TIGR01777 family oxidoreductase [Bdellovibrionales bacterium]
MIVVLTGATGLIGSHLGPELVRRGHQVRALVRDKTKAAERLDFECELYEWQGREVPPAAAIQGATAIIHLAGENVAAQRWTKARKKALRDSRVFSARALAEAVKSSPQVSLEVVISASGIGYYGDCGDQVLSEDRAAGGDFLAQLCVEWEQAAQLIPARRHVCGRLGAVLCKGEGFLGKIVPMFRLFGASRLGDGQNFLAWVQIIDVVRFFADALDKFSGPYNLCAPHPLRNSEMTEILRRQLGVWKSPSVPKFALKIMYGELSEALLSSQRAEPRKLMQENWHFEYEDFKSALDRTFSPR